MSYGNCRCLHPHRYPNNMSSTILPLQAYGAVVLAASTMLRAHLQNPSIATWDCAPPELPVSLPPPPAPTTLLSENLTP